MVWAKPNYLYSSVNGPFSSFIIEPIEANDHNKGYKLFVNRGFKYPYLGINNQNFKNYSYLVCKSNQRSVKTKLNKYTWFFDKAS